jgi:FHS family L-fucose permease-like MFS transporter
MDAAGAAAGFIVPAACLAVVTCYALFDLRAGPRDGELVTEGVH